ncbi:MAG: GNAT family N-acetyltransferase [Micromonosporaceae bacterium]
MVAARLAELDPATLYGLLQLRVDVFVVEQECLYPELDGRDMEPDTVHIWVEAAQQPPTPDGSASHHGSDRQPAAILGCLRVLREPDGAAVIGRVCTAVDARGGGVAHRLVTRALQEIGGRPCRLNAQAYLVDFYAGHGFAVTGPEFDDDGIPHVPMARPAP